MTHTLKRRKRLYRGCARCSRALSDRSCCARLVPVCPSLQRRSPSLHPCPHTPHVQALLDRPKPLPLTFQTPAVRLLRLTAPDARCSPCSQLLILQVALQAPQRGLPSLQLKEDRSTANHVTHQYITWFFPFLANATAENCLVYLFSLLLPNAHAMKCKPQEYKLFVFTNASQMDE